MAIKAKLNPRTKANVQQCFVGLILKIEQKKKKCYSLMFAWDNENWTFGSRYMVFIYKLN